MEFYSIFNDVLGPVMYGPSSSHSAAPCRIGYICQSLLLSPLKKATVYFDPESSYASTYKFHCSDRGFTAGLLGIRVDEESNLSAFRIAKERGIDISFVIEPQENKHPNYARIKLLGESDELDIGTLSTGGGMLELVSLDGFPIKVTGDRWFTFIKNPVSLPVDKCEYQLLTKDNERLLVIARYQPQSPVLPGGEWTRECAPILPVQAFTAYKMPFTNYKEALTYASSQGLSAGELGIRYEMARSGKSRDEVLSMMSHIMDVMHASVLDSTHRRGGKVFDFYPYKATEMTKNSENLPDLLRTIGKISINASAVFEHTLSVGLVVAAPTGGSCGILPSVIVELGIDLGLPRSTIINGLFAAGLVGIFLVQEATFGCEVAGCQAENGSGSAMAAAGIVEMLGGTATLSFQAAAIALQNMLGLICDPVACAYVPCVTRNAMAATNAVSSATMILSGYAAYIPLDETIQVMMDVGRKMPACHRCTGGGLNLSPTGSLLNEASAEYIQTL